MMQIQVKLYATLRKYRPELKHGEALLVRVPEGSSVGQVIAAVGIPPDAVRKAFCRGRAVEEDHVLVNGEDVALFPPIAGGEARASQERLFAGR